MVSRLCYRYPIEVKLTLIPGRDRRLPTDPIALIGGTGDRLRPLTANLRTLGARAVGGLDAVHTPSSMRHPEGLHAPVREIVNFDDAGGGRCSEQRRRRPGPARGERPRHSDPIASPSRRVGRRCPAERPAADECGSGPIGPELRIVEGTTRPGTPVFMRRKSRGHVTEQNGLHRERRSHHRT